MSGVVASGLPSPFHVWKLVAATRPLLVTPLIYETSSANVGEVGVTVLFGMGLTFGMRAEHHPGRRSAPT